MSSHGPAVFLHGGPEVTAVWSLLLEDIERDDVFLLSPPGFGVPLPDGFEATMDGYLEWLVARLEAFGQPVDLVGHDWGGVHTFNLAMNRPDLIRSWVCDVVGLFHPDYEWHPLARTVQTPDEGERWIDELSSKTMEERLAWWHEWGTLEPLATRLAAGQDAHMGRAILSLYRSSVQPRLAEAGRKASAAAARPGLVISVTDDPATGTHEMRQQVAGEAGADVVTLDGGHFWMTRKPAAGAALLNDFWARLP
ncbi:alpha/beta fold hydrolase [Streptomyces chartreusis]|uniref:Alpha/beta hydrolase n=2 Tax=Streptomyces chartreusis TaxID=1969 RepID=A0A7H8T2S8_STRCX|nr:alpha/beta hydrolase [Streptomyces chartreusis]QKZ15939.1 alpha/beta hydrolase [Streptomyces chartreusis]QKZ16005.1 alpha/beta hydrolase [Streptomyces chartreusis]QKZ17308.1 alpha/beta hydrolase [Streptomyces chartreusis]